MRVVTFKIEEDLLELLDSFAIKNKMNRSEAIRTAIIYLLKEAKEKEERMQVKVEKGSRLWGR
jgi:metal-responsive CopG/Arc/MetJ family transcriptional regulator